MAYSTYSIRPDLAFERDLDSASKTFLYSEDAVRLYRAKALDAIIGSEKAEKRLWQMIQHHRTYQVPRLKYLEDYYLGLNPSIRYGVRRKDRGRSDHRVAHAFASIISDFLNSYVIGNPIKLESKDESQADAIAECFGAFNKENDIDQHNIEIGRDQNCMGRAYELLHRRDDDKTRIYRLSPFEVFMIYDESIETRVMAACRYWAISQDEYLCEVYTHEKIYRSEPFKLTRGAGIVFKDENTSDHQFGGVPVIEYRADRFRMSVFERQIQLIDAYDAAESDTANYMTDFNDAILMLEGRIQNADDAEYLRKMKDANMMVLIPSETADGKDGAVGARYLVKSYDVQGVEAYKTRLRSDIFSLCSVPDLSDQQFAGNQSGEALKYKLYGLQQKRRDKEQYMAKGLRVRYKLIENLKRAVFEYAGDPIEIEFKFTPNLPKAYLEEIQGFVNAGGRISQETLLGLLSFVKDPKEELTRIEQEESGSVEEHTHEHIDAELAR